MFVNLILELQRCWIVQSFFPAMTKIVGTLGSRSRSVDVISGCLTAGMSGTIFFSLFNYELIYTDLFMFRFVD